MPNVLFMSHQIGGGAAPGTLLVGTTVTNLSGDTNPGGTAEAFQFTAVATGTSATVNVQVTTANTATSLVLGIYTDSAGAPGTLLGTATITSPTANNTYQSKALTGVSIVSGTKYWLAILSPNGTGTAGFNDSVSAGTAAGKTSGSTTLSALASTWTTGSTFTGASPAAINIKA